MAYELELENVISQINEKKCKNVIVQLPDGLKTKAKEIVETIQDKTEAVVITWFGSCFGACDIPLGLDGLGVDLLIQWGHNKFNRVEGW